MNQPKSTGGLTSDMVNRLLTKVILNEALVNDLKALFGTSGANWCNKFYFFIILLCKSVYILENKLSVCLSKNWRE